MMEDPKYPSTDQELADMNFMLLGIKSELSGIKVALIVVVAVLVVSLGVQCVKGQVVSAETRGSQLRDQLMNAAIKRQRLVELGPYIYDLGDRHLFLPPRLAIVGKGPGITILRTKATEPTIACAVELANGTVLRDLTIENYSTAADGEQVLVGFARKKPVPRGYRVLLNNVQILAGSWGVYAWSGDNNTLILENCEIRAGRQCVSACGSNPNSQFFDLYNCRLYVEPKRTTAGGAISAGTYGVVARGGRVRLFNCTIDVEGDAKTTTKRAIAVTNDYAAAADYGRIELHNVVSRVRQGTLKDKAGLFDVLQVRGTIDLWGGSGSGDNGKWITKGEVGGKTYGIKLEPLE